MKDQPEVEVGRFDGLVLRFAWPPAVALINAAVKCYEADRPHLLVPPDIADEFKRLSAFGAWIKTGKIAP